MKIAICQHINCDKQSEWVAGTWMFCDDHVKQYLFDNPLNEWYNSAFGTARRIGQKANLEHCERFNLNFCIKEI